MDAYGRRLQSSYTRRLCKFLPTSSFDKLFNPNGRRQQDKGVLNLCRCKGYTAEINIFEYQILLIPIFVNRRWSLIAADMQTRQVRHIDSAGEGGLPYILAIRRWMASEWKRFYKSAFPTWRSILSDSTHTPEQGTSNACGIFTIMHMQLLADVQDVQRFNVEYLLEASYYIAYRIIQPVQCSQTLARPVYQKKKDSGQIRLIPTGLCSTVENEKTEDTHPASSERDMSIIDIPSQLMDDSEDKSARYWFYLHYPRGGVIVPPNSRAIWLTDRDYPGITTLTDYRYKQFRAWVGVYLPRTTSKPMNLLRCTRERSSLRKLRDQKSTGRTMS